MNCTVCTSVYTVYIMQNHYFSLLVGRFFFYFKTTCSEKRTHNNDNQLSLTTWQPQSKSKTCSLDHSQGFVGRFLCVKMMAHSVRTISDKYTPRA